MKRTRIFTLIMAIFWSLIGILAVVLVGRSNMGAGTNIVIVALAFVAIAGNWLRWYRSR